MKSVTRKKKLIKYCLISLCNRLLKVSGQATRNVTKKQSITKEWPAHGATGNEVDSEDPTVFLASTFDHVKVFKSKTLNPRRKKLIAIYIYKKDCNTLQKHINKGLEKLTQPDQQQLNFVQSKQKTSKAIASN